MSRRVDDVVKYVFDNGHCTHDQIRERLVDVGSELESVPGMNNTFYFDAEGARVFCDFASGVYSPRNII